MDTIIDYLAKPKGTVATFATLCIVCAVFFATLLAGGCNGKGEFPKFDEDEEPNPIPIVYATSEDLPEWLNEWIDLACGDLIGVTSLGNITQVEVHKGKWEEQTVYNTWSVNSNSLLNIRNEEGERIEAPLGDVFNRQDFFSENNNWELIFQIVGGEVTIDQNGVKSAFSVNSLKDGI